MRLFISGHLFSSRSTSTSKNMKRDVFGKVFVGEAVAEAGGVGLAMLTLLLMLAFRRGSGISPRALVTRPVIPASSHASPVEMKLYQ